jgi:hypothetical protein
VKAPDLDVPALVRVGPNHEPIVNEELTSKKVIIEIPGEQNAELWREPTRAAFTRALGAGYVIEDFYLINKTTGVYLLTSP